MASRKVTDVDLLRACLLLSDTDVPPTCSNIAEHLGMVSSSVHRRLAHLVEAGVMGRRHLGVGGPVYHLKPSALDLCGEFRDGFVDVYWQVGSSGRLYLASRASD